MSLMSNIIAFPVTPVPQPLRRPAVLVRAAVAGQRYWRRERDLRRVLKVEQLPAPAQILPRLREDEDRMNAARQAGAAEYDLHQHVLLMIAILAEGRGAAVAAPAHIAR